MRTENLQPYGINQKSFYRKAVLIYDDDQSVKLLSYSTIVVEYDTKNKTMKVNGWYSMTTARHINSFLMRFGFDALPKKILDRCPTIGADGQMEFEY